MPELTPPMGASHPVACWFPDPAGVSHAMGGAQTASGAVDVDVRGGCVDEPTAREFAQG
jgi:hypothetical protein